MKIDIKNSGAVSVSSQDTEGNDFDIDGYQISFIISLEDAETELSLYDPENAYSPSATDSRDIARLILDALQLLSQ